MFICERIFTLIFKRSLLYICSNVFGSIS